MLDWLNCSFCFFLSLFGTCRAADPYASCIYSYIRSLSSSSFLPLPFHYLLCCPAASLPRLPRCSLPLCLRDCLRDSATHCNQLSCLALTNSPASLPTRRAPCRRDATRRGTPCFLPRRARDVRTRRPSSLPPSG